MTRPTLAQAAAAVRPRRLAVLPLHHEASPPPRETPLRSAVISTTVAIGDECGRGMAQVITQ